MTDLLQIFTGNPLTTFVGKKIEAATRPELESEDWTLNIEICDIINENDDDAKDAARAIRKRLLQIEQDRNFIITNRTLTVLETCVNNCSHRFHLLVMTKDFIQDLVKLIGPKNNPPIELQERVLNLIESWAEAFRAQPDLAGVVSVYTDLKAKGVTFPPQDPNNRVPIQTPQRTVPALLQQQQPPSRQDRQTRSTSTNSPMMMPAPPPNIAGQVMLEGEGYDKISQDLVVVQSSIEMFDDIMKVLESPANEDADWKLAEELSVTCKQMKDRIVDLIERIANEDLTVELLRLNDELNTTFLRYDTLQESRTKQRLSEPAAQPVVPNQPSVQSSVPTSVESSQPKSKFSGVSSSTLNELSLIDFEAARRNDVIQDKEISTSATGSRSRQAQANPLTSGDPFDTSDIPSNNKSRQSLADELSALELDPTQTQRDGSKKLTSVPEEISSVREQDFAEIENWLSTDSGRNLASISGDMPSIEPISIPNSEFDNFIASRALAGSNAPGQQQQQQQQSQHKPSQPKQEPST